MDGEVRHRRKRTTISTLPPSSTTPASPRPAGSQHEETQNGAAETPETTPLVVGEKSGVKRHWTGLPLYVGWLSRAVGLLMLLVASVTHATYMLTLHENDLWFSKIKEVEREISFRTESGLYYSYYKQLIHAPSLSQGVDDLMNDNFTEHGRTINILARMNIYQEVLLATVYKAVPLLQSWFEPIYFYINSIFALHGMLVGALYTLTWLLSGSWLAGLLAASFYIFNKEDTTRVSFVIPLRESFALPFLWAQLVFITLYFKPSIQYTSKTFHLVGVAACTFFFSITWQFNQFVLLLQAMALFAVQVLEFVPLHKVRNVYLLQAGSLFAVCLLQFGNTMILSGPCFSFILAALCIMQIQKTVRPVGVIRNILTVILYIILVFILMAIFVITAKVVMQQEADEHIGKFVLTKFGVYGDMSQRDFDVRLYLCNAAFAFIGRDVFERMTRSLVFPIYAYMHAVMVAILVIAYIQKTSTKQSSITEGEEEPDHMFRRRPDLAYHVIQTVFFGVLAVSTLRMKYLWTPYMCVLAAVGVSDKTCTTWLLERCNVTSSKAVAAVRHFLTIVVLICFLHLVLPKARKDLEDLREFYDPDTVDLMNWIKQHTAETAALTGSMQLLAGVKLCTGRPITNHPHYEDKHLRGRTKELYQMYGRRTPEDVHAIFMKYDVSYIILEDSICMAPSRGNCRLPDMMDIDNGVIPDNGAPLQDLVKSKVPRFCDKIRHSQPEYTKYFKAVFTNKTFRVYKVLRSEGPLKQKDAQ